MSEISDGLNVIFFIDCLAEAELDEPAVWKEGRLFKAKLDGVC